MHRDTAIRVLLWVENGSKGVTWNMIPPDAAVHLAAAARSSVSCFNLQLELSQGKSCEMICYWGEIRLFSARRCRRGVETDGAALCVESGSTFIHIRATTTTPPTTCVTNGSSRGALGGENKAAVDVICSGWCFMATLFASALSRVHAQARQRRGQSQMKFISIKAF